ncbi:hypothetical protein CBOM_03074 [Ceraceosorus bombacis]|uniref:Secreted protein n=1 Tax=Ceraceosorus bombacis TaxID=401625 RepID=A0A0P1BKI6_9BASI|nr:hypothetical protein CBOM_03074 [Ceraceosorus bombacis]
MTAFIFKYLLVFACLCYGTIGDKAPDGFTTHAKKYMIRSATSQNCASYPPAQACWTDICKASSRGKATINNLVDIGTSDVFWGECSTGNSSPKTDTDWTAKVATGLGFFPPGS